MTRDPNLIYPGSDLTNVFPEEGTDMKPTQAQIIERLKKRIEFANRDSNYGLAEDLIDACTAVTAAAEVGRTGQEASNRATSALDELVAPKPATQAQVEAAMGAIEIYSNYNSLDQRNPDYQKNLRRIAVAAVTAAAEVGDKRWQEVASQGIQIETQLRKELLTIELATIERCAQVAEDYDKEYMGYPTVAAAIRALKEKP